MTCIFFPTATIDAVRQSGMRAAIGLAVLDHPTNYAADADDYLSKSLAVHDACKDDPLLSFCLAPHAPYTVSDKTFEKIATLSAQLQIPVHTHLHETRHEIAESIKQYGVRPIQRLHALGLLGPQFIAVHAVHLEAAEIDQLSHTGYHIVFCPTSNLKLSSGIPNISDIHQQGINFGLGTDSAASSNRLDTFQEMRLSALLAKGLSEDATALTAHQALQAATLNGARALGLDQQIGSLLPGKTTDLRAVCLDDLILHPCFDPASQLVYTVGRDNVTHTWIAGKLKMHNDILTTIDIKQLSAHTNIWHNRIAY